MQFSLSTGIFKFYCANCNFMLKDTFKNYILQYFQLKIPHQIKAIPSPFIPTLFVQAKRLLCKSCGFKTKTTKIGATDACFKK